MAKINIEIAEQAFIGWLDFKRVRESKRENNIDQQNIIVEAIADGDLVIDEKDFFMTYNLLKPILSDDGDVMLDKLVFKPRITKGDLNKKYKGLKPTDADNRLLATIAAITDQNRGMIGKIDTDDISVCESIAVYFL